jgi:3-oxoacyl-[acyl-carrier protein] reductase
MISGLDERRALVTGAAGDIGRAIVLALAQAGADLALHDRSDASRLLATAGSVREMGRRAVIVMGDVRDPAAVSAFVGEAVEGLGGLDILVNNAGIMTEVPMLELSIEAWRDTIDTNLTGYFLCTKAAAPHLMEHGAGAIINIASQLAYRGGIGLTHYSAAKAGVLGFTRAAARELAVHGIRVNAVAPGPIETQLVAPYRTAAWTRAKLEASLLKRLGRPEEVASSVVFLASDDASLYFGQTLSPNAGGVMT